MRLPRDILGTALAMCLLAACADAQTTSVELPDGVEGAELSMHLVVPDAGDMARIELPDRDGNRLFVARDAMITQDCLVSVEREPHPVRTSTATLSFELDDVCSRKLGEMTARNVGEQFAVVIDNEIVTAPKILGPILGGAGFIEGDWTADEVDLLVLRLKHSMASADAAQ